MEDYKKTLYKWLESLFNGKVDVMSNTKCEKVNGNMMTGSMPNPPKEIEALLDEYQDFLGSVFARDNQNNTNMDAMSMHAPKLTMEEQNYIENLTRKLHSSQGWKDYIKQCKNWVFAM